MIGIDLQEQTKERRIKEICKLIYAGKILLLPHLTIPEEPTTDAEDALRFALWEYRRR